MTPSKVFYTVSEAADLLRVSERTIRDWIYRQHLHAIRLGARGTWRVPHGEIDRLARPR